MLEQMMALLEQHRPFPKDATLLLAVSGGVDSMVMTDLFRRLRACWPLTLYAVHLDHGLRPTSGDEAQAVKQTLESWGVPVAIYRADVGALAKGESIESAGHQLRRQLFRQHLHEIQGDALLLAQHRDDRVETVLLNLLRGSGVAGLSALRYQEEERVRPLLFAAKKDIIAYAESHHIPYWEDASNQSLIYRRNQLRHEVLPLLRELMPRVDQRIVETASYLEDVYDYIKNEAERWMACMMYSPRAGVYIFERKSLEAMGSSMRKEVLLAAARRWDKDKRGFAESNLKTLQQWLMEGKTDVQMDLSGDWHLLLEKKQLWLWVGSLQEAEIRYHITWNPNKDPFLCLPTGDTLTAYPTDQLYPTFVVRTAEAGDRIYIQGLGHKTVKKCFQEARLSLRERRTWPLLCDTSGKILWVPGLQETKFFLKKKEEGIIFKRAIINFASRQEDVDE